MRPVLCQPIDVMRKFDPQVTEDALINLTEGQSPIGNDDWEQITSRIEGVQSELERQTGSPHRSRQTGHPDHPETWEPVMSFERDETRRWSRLFCDLGDNEISELHGVRVRRSFDDFRDINLRNVSLNQWDGTISIRRGYLPDNIWEWISHPGFDVTASYEYGAVGGSDTRAGQTVTTESWTDGMSVQIENGQRLPPSSNVFVIGGEYVRGRVNGDTLEVIDRGLRGTTEEDEHDEGTTVHYCPMHIREGVAAKTAIEVVTYIDKIDEAVGEQFSPQEKRDQWQSEWESLLGTSAGFSSL